MISAEDLERFSQMEAERAARFKALDATREAFRDVPDEELERQVARALGEVRAERRVEEQRAADR